MVRPTLTRRTSSLLTSETATVLRYPVRYGTPPAMESFLTVGFSTVTVSPFVSVSRTDEGRSSGINCCGLTVVGRQV